MLETFGDYVQHSSLSGSIEAIGNRLFTKTIATG